MSWLTTLCKRLRTCWTTSCLRAHIAQLELGLSRPDLWPADHATIAALYAAQIAALRCELAVLEMLEPQP